MDKVISARINEAVARRIESIARRMRTSKKNVIENAIEMYAARLDEQQKIDIFEQTSGAWRRKEPVEETVRKARNAFRGSMKRNQP